MERIAIPDAFHAAHFMMIRLKEILSGLKVNKNQIARNLQLMGDLPSSQAYLNALINSGLSRKKAYALIQSASLKAGPLHKNLNLKKLDPQHFLNHMPALYKRCGVRWAQD